MPHSSVSSVDPSGEHRIGGLPAQRLLDRRPQQAAVGADGLEQLGPSQQRRERDAHLLPGRARPGGEQQVGERVDLVVGEAVGAVLVGELGLDQHADEVVLRARARRASTIGARISATFAGSRRCSRTSSAWSTSMPKLPVIVSTGMAAQKSTLSSASPVVDERVDQRVHRLVDPLARSTTAPWPARTTAARAPGSGGAGRRPSMSMLDSKPTRGSTSDRAGRRREHLGVAVGLVARRVARTPRSAAGRGRAGRARTGRPRRRRARARCRRGPGPDSRSSCQRGCGSSV